jgi:hypothetical protein
MNTKNNTCTVLSSNIVALGQELKATTDTDLQVALINAIVACSNALRAELELNEGGDQEVFDSLANEGRIAKYVGSVRVPTGNNNGVKLTGNEWANLAEKGFPGKKSGFWK